MMKTTCLCVFLAVLLLAERFTSTTSLTTNVNIQNGVITYSRAQLMQLDGPYDRPALPDDVDDIQKRPRKRGRRGGVRARCRRRGCRLPMPMMVCGNVRSIRNKIDELTALTRWNFAYRESSLICLTETWLQDKDPCSVYELDGFTLFRGDRSNTTGKSQGGGVCVYVNNQWSKDMRIYEQYCDNNIEFLTLSIRPYYLPREFSKVFVSVVYIPPDADVKSAENTLSAAVSKMEDDNPEAVKLITGDFNECQFGKCIPTYKQYIRFPTRGDKLLDPVFCNIKNAYVSKELTPLGVSDHCMCHLVPVYRQKLKRSKPTERLVYQWSDEINETLLACIECTNFDCLFDPSEHVDHNTEVLTDYINFCIDMLVPKKSIKCFGNNKPWVTKDLKILLNKKKHFLAIKDREQLKIIQKEIDKNITDSKRKHKVKVEGLFKHDAKSAWRGVKQLSGMTKTEYKHDVDDVKQFCDELNIFYSRFDKHDFSAVRNIIVSHLKHRSYERLIITEDEVLKSLKSVKVGKATGPDKIGANILKLCSVPLAPAICNIYQQSLDQACVPRLWKTSEIVPLPKKVPPACNNDFRPVALTAIVMKCFERIVKGLLYPQVTEFTDPLQFAYTSSRCVEDASLSLINYVLKHVDKANNPTNKHFCKILFIDFSSAFNTIQPHIIMQKLINMNVHPTLILWINNFLTVRPQYVKYRNAISDVLVTNTGAPQGCVLSPLLFTLYTSDCRSNTINCQLYKYADDTALAARCTNDDDSYRTEVARFIEWCSDNFLELNVKKTKEMITDFRTSDVVHPPLYINNEVVEIVHEYKYLGTIIDDKFNFNQNLNTVHKKVNSRIFFLRQLHKLNIDNTILQLFYTSVIQSVITFSMTCWFGNTSSEAKGRLTRVINNCKKLGADNASSLEELFNKCVIQRCVAIRKDITHPLNCEYSLLPSGRRVSSVRCRTSRYAKSFIPSSMKIINNQ